MKNLDTPPSVSVQLCHVTAGACSGSYLPRSACGCQYCRGSTLAPQSEDQRGETGNVELDLRSFIGYFRFVTSKQYDSGCNGRPCSCERGADKRGLCSGAATYLRQRQHSHQILPRSQDEDAPNCLGRCAPPRCRVSFVRIERHGLGVGLG